MWVRVTIMSSIFEVVSRILYFLFGSARLRQHEQACLDAWRRTLSESVDQKVRTQIAEFDLIQRQARGVKSVFYSIRDPQYASWGDELLLSVKDKSCRVFEGVLVGKVGDITESVRFCIYIHRGRLFSIEFSSEPGALSSIADDLKVIKEKVLVEIKDHS